MWVLASVGLFVCLYGRLMIPRKEKITRVKAQGESFYPVKSKGDSLLSHQISVLPALYTSDGGKFTGRAPEPAEAKDGRDMGTKPPQDHSFQLSGESIQSGSGEVKDKFFPKENLLVHTRDLNKERTVPRTVAT